MGDRCLVDRIDDREGAIGFSIALYLAPLIALVTTIAGAMAIVTPRSSPSRR